MKKTIFVSIASYRDPELVKTVKDMLSKAKEPDNLRITVAWQHSQEDAWDNFKDLFEKDHRFNIIDIDHKDSLGVCWARNTIQQHYNNEDYYLQLDSHHRFSQNWDRTLKDWTNFLMCDGFEKPILSSYLPSYDPKDEIKLFEVWGLNIDRFLPEGAVFLRPHYVDNWQDLNKPFRSRFLSAHFIFTVGQFAREVLYDPNLYFHGEETSISARAYTHGYDIFGPHIPVIWHEYTRDGKKKHWDDVSNWSELDIQSYARFRKLFGMDPGCSPCQRKNLEPYAFGAIRTLEDYEKYSGLKFSTRQIHNQTRTNQFPPITEDYESGLRDVKKYCVDIYKQSLIEKDYDCFVVAFMDENGNEIHRQDANKQEIERLFSEDKKDLFLHIWREFESSSKAKKWRVWPHSESKGWMDKIEQDIRYE
jgi:hypothetical protein